MKTRFFFPLAVLFVIWVAVDLWYPRQYDLRRFDYAAVARLDAAMWRSYYEKKPLVLFWQSAELMRKQLNAPFWRSFVMAYHVAKSAFLFKEGKNRTDYGKALPDLEKFYGAVNDLSEKPFNVKKASQLELEWWIIRRYREQHPPVEWAELQAQVAGEIYHLSFEKFREYGRIRTEAMFFRDRRGDKITEADWKRIQTMLEQSWQSLSESLTL
jgi:hypothetical protein